MKKINIILGLFLLLGILFSSCKKYEEGPKFSLTSPIKRILGDYELRYVKINEQVIFNNDTSNATAHFSNSSSNYDKNFSFNFPSTKIYGVWEFDEGRDQIKFSNIYVEEEENELISPFLEKKKDFIIKKLTQDELFIEKKVENNIYRYELKKKD